MAFLGGSAQGEPPRRAKIDTVWARASISVTPVRQAIYAQSKHFYDCAVTIPTVEPFPKVVRGRYRWFIIIYHDPERAPALGALSELPTGRPWDPAHSLTVIGSSLLGSFVCALRVPEPGLRRPKRPHFPMDMYEFR